MVIKVIGIERYTSKDGFKKVEVYYSYDFTSHFPGEGVRCGSMVFPDTDNLRDILVLGGDYSIEFGTYRDFDGTFSTGPVGLVLLNDIQK